MLKTYQALMVLLARATDRELARQIQFLKAENVILRTRLPKRIITTSGERRRLVKLGKPLGPAIKNPITIVKSDTFARWVRGSQGNTDDRERRRREVCLIRQNRSANRRSKPTWIQMRGKPQSAVSSETLRPVPGSRRASLDSCPKPGR